jgi:hypothetical protein
MYNGVLFSHNEEIMLFAQKWMEVIILSAILQIQKFLSFIESKFKTNKQT